MVELIKGRWYKNLGTKKNFIAKYVAPYSSSNPFGLFEYISDNGYKKVKYKNYIQSIYPILITDISEIAHLLPKDHPDLNFQNKYELW